jgi:hypothetical protein
LRDARERDKPQKVDVVRRIGILLLLFVETCFSFLMDGGAQNILM